jgi:hypothetical protein
MLILMIFTWGCTQIDIPGFLPNQPEQSGGSTGIPFETPTLEPSPTTLQPKQQTQAANNEIQDLSTETPTEIAPTQDTIAEEIGSMLAYLSNGNLSLVEFPLGKPYKLTDSGDILSFTWGHDGSKLLSYNGYSLCHVSLDGNGTTDCVDLGLNNLQATIERQIAVSPDGRYAALWNPINPWDEEAVGWLVVDLTGSGETWHVLDPVDWGAQLAPDNEPGGVTGQALFLNDGSVIGTVTHRWLCTGTAGCHYKLFTFDFTNRSLIPFDNKPEEGFSEGLGLVLSDGGGLLLNHGTFHAGCEAYITFVDIFNLETSERRIYNLDQVAINGLALAPNNQQAVIARNAGCSTENQNQWAQTCGISQGFDIYNMQLWNLIDEQREDLIAGIQPDWSSDGQYLTFQSCLSESPEGVWNPNGEQTPSIYVYDFSQGKIVQVSQGQTPKWQP